MMEIIYKEAVISDLEVIVVLLANDKLGSKRENFTSPMHESYINAFHKTVSDSNQKLMVAVSAEQVVGTFQLSYLQYLTYQGGVRAQIEAVRVHEQYRGKGLGKALIEKAIALARQKGAHVVQLTTDKQRPEALRFYKNLGFTASHEGLKLHMK